MFASVSDAKLADQGIWVSKLPARTGEGPFDAARVQAASSPATMAPCALKLEADAFAPSPIELGTVDVTGHVTIETATPKIDKLIP